MTTEQGAVVLEVQGLQKDYAGLRPLRVAHFEVRQGQSVALVGLDRVTAEVLVNLITGAVTPDTGEILIFGQSTRAITDGDAWLASLNRFGILSERAVLLDALSVQQNLALPFSLELDSIPPDIQAQVEQLARDVGLTADDLPRPVSAVSPAVQLRVRLARAVALNPSILLCEHPNAMAPADVLSDFAADLVRLIARRGVTTLTLTADARFASTVATRVLTLQPATGELRASRAAWGWVPWNRT